jgi:hypothetical protein
VKNVASAGRFYSAGARHARRQQTTTSMVLAPGEPAANVTAVDGFLRNRPTTTVTQNDERNGFSPAR